MAVILARLSASTFAIDIDVTRIAELIAGINCVPEVNHAELSHQVPFYANDSAALTWPDFYIVAVPPPINSLSRASFSAV